MKISYQTLLLPLGHQQHLFLGVFVLFSLLSMLCFIYSELLQLGSASHPSLWLYGFLKVYDSPRSHIYIRIIAYSLLIDELKPQCLAPSFFPVLCTEALGTSEKPVFLKNLCQTWFSFSLSPSLLVTGRFCHQLLGSRSGERNSHVQHLVTGLSVPVWLAVPGSF